MSNCERPRASPKMDEAKKPISIIKEVESILTRVSETEIKIGKVHGCFISDAQLTKVNACLDELKEMVSLARVDRLILREQQDRQSVPELLDSSVSTHTKAEVEAKRALIRDEIAVLRHTIRTNVDHPQIDELMKRLDDLTQQLRGPLKREYRLARP